MIKYKFQGAGDSDFSRQGPKIYLSTLFIQVCYNTQRLAQKTYQPTCVMFLCNHKLGKKFDMERRGQIFEVMFQTKDLFRVL